MAQSASTAAPGQAGAAQTPDAVAPATSVALETPTASPSSSPATSPGPTPPASATSKLAVEGLLAAIGSFVIWGVLPLYLKPIHDLPSLQIIAHRICWACVFVLLWLLVRGDLGKLRQALTSPTLMGCLIASALLITANWVAFIWGVGHGRVVETSLGYFINPLANVLLGVVILRERLNAAQWTAVAIAAGAVVYLAVATGSTPWIALTLATSFSTYGLIRKVAHIEALQGLAIETLILMPLALGYLVWCEAQGVGAFGHSSLTVDALLIGCGPITAVPLFLFAFGARLIPYSTVGLLLYIAPSLQLLCGIYLYHEPFAGPRALGFVFIWLALLIYAGDGLWRARQQS
jgi:chloramphenicol-sensitive protein RarD